MGFTTEVPQSAVVTDYVVLPDRVQPTVFQGTQQKEQGRFIVFDRENTLNECFCMLARDVD